MMIRNRPINISGVRHIGNDVRISPFMGIRPSRDTRNLDFFFFFSKKKKKKTKKQPAQISFNKLFTFIHCNIRLILSVKYIPLLNCYLYYYYCFRYDLLLHHPVTCDCSVTRELTWCRFRDVHRNLASIFPLFFSLVRSAG